MRAPLKGCIFALEMHRKTGHKRTRQGLLP